MAESQRKSVGSKGFSGWQEPQYPSGYHLTEGAIVGTTSGGDMVLGFDFALASELRNSQYYSIEDLRVTVFEQAESNLELSIVNFDSAITTRFSVRVEGTDSGFGSAEPHVVRGLQGLFLGRQASASAVTSVDITANNNDGVLMRVFLAGYIWSSRSTNVPGGPQRPLTGMYRS
jgi:hypothetical protein